MQIQEQPYERFMKFGAGSLTNAELIAIILRTGTSKATALDLSRRILTCHQPDNESLSVLYDLTMKDLMSIHGIGQVKAVKILCLSEVAKRISSENARAKLSFTSPESIADCYMEELRHEKREKCLLLLMDSRLSLIREEVISIGTVDRALLSTRDIYSRALREDAVYIAILHNHPSGDPAPSEDDMIMTEKIQKAGELVDVVLVDHMIIGDGVYYSMREHGYIP